MKVLIVGGTGNISWRFANAALAEGWEVTLLNRGVGLRRSPPRDCRLMVCDIRDRQTTETVLGATLFDGVIDFLCYNEQHARDAVSLFAKRTRHYIFISTTALYDRSTSSQPLCESSSTIRDGWEYAVAKARAEQVFAAAVLRIGFPVTIIRPAHTYDVLLPDAVGFADWTNPWRALNGKPLVVHGDGTTLWTLTHSIDLANGIVCLLKAGAAPGQAYHITSGELFTWNDITTALCHSIGIDDPALRHRTTEQIARVSPKLGAGLRGHKMWCDIYDNTKFRTLCPSWQPSISLAKGLDAAVAHYRQDARRMMPNLELDAVLDEICRLS